jgi:hypothetical protein
MNIFKKYCPNVWIAECEEEHKKGDIILLTTKYGKEVECEVYNFIGKTKIDGKFQYSIVRTDEKSYAERKAERYRNSEDKHKHNQKSTEWFEKSQEGREFLKLAEPIKIGHHSEKKHRALIERNNARMGNSVRESDIAEEKKQKAEYWERKAKEINLSMPESLDFYKNELEKAKQKHKGLKDGSIPKEHSYAVTYAKKEVNELTKKLEIAHKLWGES